MAADLHDNAQKLGGGLGGRFLPRTIDWTFNISTRIFTRDPSCRAGRWRFVIWQFNWWNYCAPRVGGWFMVLARGDLSTKHSFNVSEFLAVGAFIILPVALSFDGNLRADGGFLILGYILLAWRFIRSRRKIEPEILTENSSLTDATALLLAGVLSSGSNFTFDFKIFLELTDLLGVTQVVTG